MGGWCPLGGWCPRLQLFQLIQLIRPCPHLECGLGVPDLGAEHGDRIWVLDLETRPEVRRWSLKARLEYGPGPGVKAGVSGPGMLTWSQDSL